MTTTVVARCVHGLEWVCADEITQRLPTARELELARREVTFRLPSIDPALFDLRTVDDVFIAVGEVDDVGKTLEVLPRLAERVARLPFPAATEDLAAVRPLARRPRFDVVASIEGRRRYNRFEVENAVGLALAPRLNGSQLVRTGDGRGPGEPADLTVRLFLRGSTVVTALRLGARPLHRRAYKQDTGPGTLHPPVAAALARLADPPASAVLLDPFCGDGTIAIEAALAYPYTRIAAADIDPVRLGNADRNAGRAGVRPGLIRADAGRPPWRPRSVGSVLTNPPWNVAVDARGQVAGSLDEFWRRLPDALATGARVGVVADADLAAPDAVRRLGFPVTLAVRIRLAGRMSHVMLCGVPGQAAPILPAGLVRWRRQAIATAVVTESGF